MALCTMKSLLDDAQKRKCAVGAFSVGNMEMVMGAIAAAEEMNTPIIIQIAQIRLKNSPLHLIGPMMISAAKNAKVDIAVHLDHGTSLDVIKQALDMGFTSVMFDGSHLPLDDNISVTRSVVDIASPKGVSVEAELGILGKDEAGNTLCEMSYTNPKDAKFFTDNVNVSALALAIGNAHGHYSAKPELRFDILDDVCNIIETPLVLHGGSGISDEEFKKCIRHGIRKINIATSSFDALTENTVKYCQENDKWNFFSINEKMVDGVKENVKRHIQIFMK